MRIIKESEHESDHSGQKYSDPNRSGNNSNKINLQHMYTIQKTASHDNEMSKETKINAFKRTNTLNNSHGTKAM